MMAAADHLSPTQFTEVHRAVHGDAGGQSTAEGYLNANAEGGQAFGNYWHEDRGYVENWATRSGKAGMVVSGTVAREHLRQPENEDVDGINLHYPVRVTRVAEQHPDGTSRVLPHSGGLTLDPDDGMGAHH